MANYPAGETKRGCYGPLTGQKTVPPADSSQVMTRRRPGHPDPSETKTKPEVIHPEQRQRAVLKMTIVDVCEKAMCLGLSYEDLIAEFEVAWWHENRKFGR